MPDYLEIYSQQAGQYEALVSREDYQHRILPALQQIAPLEGRTVVEFGAGTGRLTCMLAPLVKFIYAFDASAHMLEVARAKLEQSGLTNWHIAVGDHRQVSAPDGVADVAISGWSMCYMVVGNDETWKTELAKALDETHRVLRPGGTLIILETLGTGREQPDPPAILTQYYASLEAHGFQRVWIRTDYQFRDPIEAETLTRFFFDDEMVANIVQDERGVILPECTGIWWRRA
jgi:ubiquinone/menaquinone biosynthesis C-methylase UbiE